MYENPSIELQCFSHCLPLSSYFYSFYVPSFVFSLFLELFHSLAFSLWLTLYSSTLLPTISFFPPLCCVHHPSTTASAPHVPGSLFWYFVFSLVQPCLFMLCRDTVSLLTICIALACVPRFVVVPIALTLTGIFLKLRINSALAISRTIFSIFVSTLNHCNLWLPWDINLKPYLIEMPRYWDGIFWLVGSAQKRLY